MKNRIKRLRKLFTYSLSSMNIRIVNNYHHIAASRVAVIGSASRPKASTCCWQRIGRGSAVDGLEPRRCTTVKPTSSLRAHRKTKSITITNRKGDRSIGKLMTHNAPPVCPTKCYSYAHTTDI